MAWPKNVLFIYNGSPESTSGQLFHTACKKMSRVSHCRIESNSHTKLNFRSFAASLVESVRRSKLIWNSDTIVVHCRSIFSMYDIILTKILGKRVVLFQWDVYPSTISGIPISNSKLRSVTDWIEARLLNLVDTVVVPSGDFMPYIKHKDVEIVHLWAASNKSSPIDRSQSKKSPEEPWRICFAGQISELRWVKGSFDRLTKNAVQDFEFHVFSADPLPPGLDNERVFYHGFRQPNELLIEMSNMHFGLVSLHPEFDQPAFPSKIFDFVSCGLPVLYVGPELKAFTSLLESSGLARKLAEHKKIDLEGIYNSIEENLAAGQQNFLNQTDLTEEKLRAIFCRSLR